MALLLCACAIGCKREPSPNHRVERSPESTFQEIERQFVAGDLRTAQQNGEAAFRYYAALDPVWANRFRVELARVYLYQGQSAEAEKLLREPLSSPDNDLVVRQNLLLAVAEVRLERTRLGNEYLAKAEALHPQGAMKAEMHGFEGIVAREQGLLTQAQGLFRTALEEAHQQHQRFIEMEMWMNLGVVALRLQHYEDALDGFNQATVFAQSLGAGLALEKALGNLGDTYYQTGDFARALENANRAEEQAAAIGAPLDQVQWLSNAGKSQFSTNNPAAAQASLEKSLVLAASLDNFEELIGAHLALAQLLLHREPEAARRHIDEGTRLARLRQNGQELVESLLLDALLCVEQGRLTEAEGKLLDLVKQADSAPSFQWEAENTLATLYANAGRRQDADRWFQRAIATFHRQRLTLKSVELKLPFLENGSDLYLDYMEHLIRTHRTDEALQVLDQSRAETLAEGLGTAGRTAATIVQPRALAARLQATILVYCLRPQASFLWAIGPKQAQFYTLAGSEAILPLVARHTQAILGSKDLLAQQDATARPLYDLLVRPAEALLAPSGRVVLIADKDLGSLNFETLVPAPQPGAPPHYWIEDVALTNARSLRLLAASHEAANPATAQLLLLGDPIYSPQDYPALPNAAAELTRVAGHFTPERRAVFAGPQATPAAYAAANPGRFAYIHFVAHATASEINPLDSAIILSGSPGPYKLYARDLLGQPLRADLVTLSSCFGSGTRRYSGEGVVGLVWAFLRAGAHSVIGAMWEVSDVSTPQLMDTLYTQLLAGNSPDQALRSAKLAMLHGNGVFRKPLYWASFQLYTGR